MLHRLLIFLAAAAAIGREAPAAEPAKLAESARFDLTADASVGSIDEGRSLEGGAMVGRMNWVSEADRPHGYTVSFPVGHRGWHAAAIRFTPMHSGTVAITLMGPWEEARKGVRFKQEVLWDDIRAEGATLAGGGFEPADGRPAAPAWQGQGVASTRIDGIPAAQGTHYARTWHDRPLHATMAVTGGRPVTIRLSARALPPAGFVEMKRIPGRATPAHRAARRFLRGMNLGNGLEVPPGQDWDVHHTPEDLRLIRAEGFDHARIPIGWHHHTGPGPEFRIRPEFFARVDALVDAGLAQGLAVMIDIHHFDDFTRDPGGQTPKFLAIWDQLAAHYAGRPDGLAFELLNEPKDAATTEVVNPIYAEAIRRIRRLAPGRPIFVGPGRWNGVDELGRLRLPDDDPNLIVTVHSYEPFLFTHQGATWTGPDTKITGIVFPGPPRAPLRPGPDLKVSPWVLDWIEWYNTRPTASNPSAPAVVEAVIEKAREWSEYYGRPIHFGEFGCITTADPASRAAYLQAFREAAERAGIGWALWEWKAGFRYWDPKAGRPEPGLRQALFGQPARGTTR